MKSVVFLSLALLFFYPSAEARQTFSRGKSSQKNFQFHPKDCHQTFFAQSADDLLHYDRQRTIYGVDNKLVIRGSISSDVIRIESHCEVKIMPQVSLTASEDIILFAKNLLLGAKTALKAKDLYVKTEKELRFTAGTNVSANRILLQAEDDIEFKNPSEIKSKLAILNAKKCKIHEETIFQAEQVLGSCFNAPEALVKLKATPTNGYYPLVVGFDVTGSFGLIDQLVFNFGNGETYSTSQQEVVYTYETEGTFQANVSAVGDFGSLSSESVTITSTRPPQNDFNIEYGIIRVNPPQVAMSSDRIPDLSGGVKEFHWNFGDQVKLDVPFALSNFGVVSHQYAQDGIYTLSLRVKGQNDFVTAPVEKVIDTHNSSLPSPRYRISSFKGDAPFTVEVEALETTDPDGEALRYFWLFTDTGETIPLGNQRVVQHTFNSPGIYSINLYTVDSKEGQPAVFIPIYVGQQNSLPSLPPYAVLDTTERFGSAPFKVDFSAARSFDPDGPSDQPVSYEWLFFDSGIGQEISSSGMNFSYTFTKPGTYFVNLIVTDVTGQQATTRVPIFVDGNQSSGSGFIIRALNQPRTYNMNASSLTVGNDYDPESFSWDFGDGSFAKRITVTKTYSEVGSYVVKLKARKIDGPYEEFVRFLTVTENALDESAIIIANPELFNLNEPVQFTATFSNDSINVANTTFTWTFGDGTSVKGMGQDYLTVDHIYSQTGSYNVSLYTEFESGQSSFNQYIIQPNQTPLMGEIKVYGQFESPAPARLGFAPWETASDSDGYISQFVYEWGDGSPTEITSEGYLEHEFLEAGTYVVKITVIDNFGARASNTVEIIVNPNKAPLADFDIHYGGESAPVNVGIEAWQKSLDQDGWITEYEYEFGDGQKISTNEGYVEHIYLNPGNYQIKLRVKDNLGLWSAQVSKSFFVAENKLPVIGEVKIYGDVNSPAPISLLFAPWENSTDADGFIVSWIYDFGDGTVVETNEGALEHLYTSAGKYNISISGVDDKGGKGTRSFEILIKENQAPILIQNVAVLDPVAPGKIGVSAWQSFDVDGWIALYEYDFGDGQSLVSTNGYAEHDFSSSGSYLVRVRIQDNLGLWSEWTETSITINENQGPQVIADINQSGSFAPVQISLEIGNSYDPDGYIANFNIDFGDGSTAEGMQTYYEHTYSDAGEYQVTVSAVDDKGKISSVIKNISVQKNLLPIGQITLSSQGPFFVHNKITASAFGSIDPDGTIVDYTWDWGDGTVVGGIFSDHVYEEAGDYVLTLSLRDDRGETSTFFKVIQVLPNLPPIISLNHSPTTIKQFELVTFDASASSDPDGEIVFFEWKFSDGEVLYGKKVPKFFEEPGSYSVLLTVRDNNGFEISNSINFTVNTNLNLLPVPKIYISSDPANVMFYFYLSARDSVSQTSEIVSYEWDLGDGSPLRFTEELYYDYEQAGEYTITLKVTDLEGRTNSTFLNVKFHPGEKVVTDPSPMAFQLNGISNGKFNPMLPSLSLNAVGGSIGSVSGIVFNGEDVSNYTIAAEQVFVPKPTLEGKNTLQIHAVDSSGRSMSQEFSFYSGSKTVTIDTSNAHGKIKANIHIVGDAEMKSEFILDYGDRFSVSNIPSSLVTFVVLNDESNNIAYGPIYEEQDEGMLNFIPMKEPSPMNLDFEDDLTGWQISDNTGHIQEKEGVKYLNFGLLNSNENTVTNSFQVEEDKFVSMNREVIGTDSSVVVFNIYRNSSGEIKYQSHLLKEGRQDQYGNFVLDLENFSFPVKAGQILESKTSLFTKTVSSASYNFSNSFYAFAQNNTPTQMNLRLKLTSHIIKAFNLYSENKDINIPQYFSRQLCNLGIGNNAYVNGSQSRVNAFIELQGNPGSRIRALGIVAEDISTGQPIALFGPTNTDNTYFEIGQSCLDSEGNIASKGCEYRSLVKRSYYLDSNFYQVFPADAPNVSVGTQVNLKLLTTSAELNLSSNLDLINGGLYKKLIEIGLVEVSEYNAEKKTCHDLDVLTFIHGETDRFMRNHDLLGIGGDSWAQLHVRNQLAKMGRKIAINDISLMHGGQFDHETHLNGLDVDFQIFKSTSLYNHGSYSFQKDVNGVEKTFTEDIYGFDFSYDDFNRLKELVAISRESISSVRGSLYGSKEEGKKTFIFADKQIIRSNDLVNAEKEFDFFRNRTCIEGKAMKDFFKNDPKLGHTDHWHMSFKPFGKIQPLTEIKKTPLLSNRSFSSADGFYFIEFDLESFNASTFVDVYFLDKDKKEKRLFQNVNGSDYRLTCKDSQLEGLSWCNEWAFFDPTFSNGHFTLKIDAQKFIEKLALLSTLKIRITNLTKPNECYETNDPLMNQVSLSVRINPRGTYYFVDTVGGYQENGNFLKDIVVSPTTLNLTNLYNDPTINLRQGDVILLQSVGAVQPGPGWSDDSNVLAAVFRDESGNFLAPGHDGEFNPITTPNTYPRGLPTDIPQDFFVPSNRASPVQIPFGATNIAFSLSDSYFADNTDPNGDFGAIIKLIIIRKPQSPLP